MSLDTETQLQAAASPLVLCSGQFRRSTEACRYRSNDCTPRTTCVSSYKKVSIH